MGREIQEQVRALNLGRKIRELRLRKGLTLRNVSDLTGLSKPLLSQIENDIAAPPIATLLKISRALGVSIGYFFQEIPTPDQIVVVRQEDRREAMSRIHEEAAKIGYRYESLAYPRADKQMEPFMVEIEPRSDEDLPFYNHRGEEFLFVLEGEVEFRGGDKVIALGPGDSLYFDSDIPHALRGLRDRPGRALVVIYAPV
jgi:transcriptional regulator with XRE-family HTH domain